MGITRWTSPIATAQSDGPTLTAAAAATCLPSHTQLSLPSGFFATPGKTLRVRAAGRISCAATTPGTARFDVRLGTLGSGTVAWDSLAVPLNVSGVTSAPWLLDVELTARVVGSAAQLIGSGTLTSHAVIGSPSISVGGAGVMPLPYNSTPGTLGTAFDARGSLPFDLYFTQTVASGSLTLHQLCLEEIG